MNNPDFEVARVALSEAVALMAEGCPRLAGYQVDLARVAINAGLEREKGGDLKNNAPGGADEGQPVKGDTARDGGMLKAVRDRVQAEYDELSEKSCKLYVFMGGESFQILSEKHRELLEQQSNVMAEYGQIIQERLNLLDDEYTHGGADEGQPVKGDTARDGGQQYCAGCGRVVGCVCSKRGG